MSLIRAATGIATLIVAASVAAHAARADGRLEARYKVSVAGIAVGKSEINVAITGSDYAVSANGRASGMLRILVSGEGTLATRGTIVDGRLVPTSFTSSTTQEDEKAEVKMTLDGGAVKDLSAETTSSASDRIALTEEHRKGIVDPMTALLVTVGGSGDVLAPEACQRTLPIFDGRRRYDLKLAFKRIDTVKAEKSGDRGPPRFEPAGEISGRRTRHRACTRADRGDAHARAVPPVDRQHARQHGDRGGRVRDDADDVDPRGASAEGDGAVTMTLIG